MPLTRFGELTPQIHPTAWVHPSAQLLGEVQLAEEVSIWPNCVLRGDSGLISLGARTNFQDASVAHATGGFSHTEVGSDVTVGHRVILHGCKIGNHCLIGMGSIVLDNVELGEWSFVGAGSLLTPGKKFPPRSFLVGSPAKRLREVNDSDLAAIVHGGQTYLELVKVYRLESSR